MSECLGLAIVEIKMSWACNENHFLTKFCINYSAPFKLVPKLVGGQGGGGTWVSSKIFSLRSGHNSWIRCRQIHLS